MTDDASAALLSSCNSRMRQAVRFRVRDTEAELSRLPSFTLQESRQNLTSAASGVAYARISGATNLLNWPMMDRN
jgi:hypothetical protein